MSSATAFSKPPNLISHFSGMSCLDDDQPTIVSDIIHDLHSRFTKRPQNQFKMLFLVVLVCLRFCGPGLSDVLIPHRRVAVD